MTVTREPHVIESERVPLQSVAGTDSTYRVVIDRENSGCQNLVQRVFYYAPGTSPKMRNTDSEDVVFIVSGTGEAVVDGKAHALTERMGLLIPPGASYHFRNPGPETLELVSVLAPQPADPGSLDASPEARPVDGKLTVHEDEEEPIQAGIERYFKLMIDPRYGCKYVTQFVGYIDKVNPQVHSHTYEEVIYILSGEGIVHIGEQDIPIQRGSCIYLPPGTWHCVENPYEGTVLRLLGVFCPAGSPGAYTPKDPQG